MKKICFVALVFSLAVLMVGMIGCRDITGGGWINSAAGPGAKATFGLEFYCEAVSGPDTASGFITYHDHGVSASDYGVGKRKTKLAFHGEVSRPDGVLLPDECNPLNFYGQYVGTYTPIPPHLGDPSNPGIMYVKAIDGGLEGPDKLDFLVIRLEGGVFDGYVNYGFLKGGNLTVQ